MTTPQRQLDDIHHKLNDLVRDLKYVDPDNEDDLCVFEQIKHLHRNNERIVNLLDMIQNQLSLIIKLLSK